MNIRPLSTILAALRFYQIHCHGDEDLLRLMPHSIADIATNAGALKPLDDIEIDDLCESLNVGHVSFEVTPGIREALAAISRLLPYDEDGAARWDGDTQLTTKWDPEDAMRVINFHIANARSVLEANPPRVDLITHLGEEILEIRKALAGDDLSRADWLCRKAIEHIASNPSALRSRRVLLSHKSLQVQDSPTEGIGRSVLEALADLDNNLVRRYGKEASLLLDRTFCEKFDLIADLMEEPCGEWPTQFDPVPTAGFTISRLPIAEPSGTP